MKNKNKNNNFVCFISQLGGKAAPIESEISIEYDTSELLEQSTDDNDYLLALMLQHEYNNEFNGMMKKYESTVNRNSKGMSKGEVRF